MSGFEEKMKQKKLDENEMLRDSFRNLEFAILSGSSSENIRDDLAATQKAVDAVLKYFGRKSIKIPSYIEDFASRLEYATCPHGIMRREVRLEKNWYKNSFGPIIAFSRKDGRPVALIPNRVSGYTFRDFTSGSTVHLNKFTEKLFKEDAWCFYRPLPQKNKGKLSLLKYLGQSISVFDYILAAAATLAAAALGLLIPRITLLVTGKAAVDRDEALLFSVLALLLGVLLSSQLIKIVKDLIIKRIKLKASVTVGAGVMARLISLPASFFRKYSSGDLYSRSCYASTLCDILIDDVFSVSIGAVASLLYLIQINSITPDLFVPTLLIVLTIMASSVIASVMQTRVNQKRIRLEAEQMGTEYSLMAGIQRIKTSGAERRIFSKWADAYSEIAKEAYNPPLYLKIFPVLPTIISLFGTIMIYTTAYLSEKIWVTEYLAFSAAFGILIASINELSKAALLMSEAVPIMEMLRPILEETPETSEDKEIITGLKGDIDIHNISFAYDSCTKLVLDDFSLSIREGDYVAIVGRSGSGKSTLMRIMLGFEKPEKGMILYDGKDMNRVDLKSLRRCIGTVLQNDTLIFGDIFTNITFRSPDLTIEDAWRAAEIAGIADDIRAMPMGMKTMIDESSGTISGGQKQRILIARAIVTKPNILFFDEATSALDNITQKQVADALGAMDCTRIVIAHRLSTVRDCGRILVMDEGRIIEQGAYDELVERGGAFAELVRRQRLDIAV